MLENDADRLFGICHRDRTAAARTKQSTYQRLIVGAGHRRRQCDGADGDHGRDDRGIYSDDLVITSPMAGRILNRRTAME